MSVMDKLRQMLKGHGEPIGEDHDKAGQPAGEQPHGAQPGQVDKGPDALREQMRSRPEQDNPPQP
ncbi:antitoxin [Streptomyces sp. NPDC001796]|uniref:antitoxin n=1 Tax=Streptomyces sp. NPDC001796 TaxID=3364609 RepID=UPI0036A9FC08